MIATWLQRVSSLGIWGGTCSLFGLFIASGNIVLGALILIALLLFVIILLGPQVVAALLLLGSPTVFGVPNEILRPLPFVTMERLLLGLLIALVFLQHAFVKGKQTSLLRVEHLIVIFLSFAFVSLLANTSKETMSRDMWFLFQYALPMVTFMVSRRIDWTEQGIKFLLACLTAVGVFLAVVGVPQALFGITIFTMNYQNVTAGHVNRAYGTFSNAHTYIASLFILFTVTLMQFSMYRDTLIRLVLGGAMLVMLVGIVLGQTRAPWIGAAIAFSLIFYRDRNIRPLMLIGGIGAAIAGSIFFALKIDELGGFLERVTTTGTMDGRLAVWATALNMIWHNPLFGIGFGADAFMLNKPEYITGIGSLTAQYAVYLTVPHNEFLHVGVLLGLIGLSLFIAIFFQLLRLMLGMHTDPEKSAAIRLMSMYVGAMVVGLLVNSMFSDTFVQDYFWLLAYFLAGLVAGMPKNFRFIQ